MHTVLQQNPPQHLSIDSSLSLIKCAAAEERVLTEGQGKASFNRFLGIKAEVGVNLNFLVRSPLSPVMGNLNQTPQEM